MNLREKKKKMDNEKDICMALKKMTLEEFANILNSYNEINANNNKKEEINEQTSKKILYTIDELIEEYPFLEKIFMYAFTNYSEKEVYALFGLNKNNIRLDDFYFDKEKIKLLVKNVF